MPDDERFQATVLARLESVDAALQRLEARMEKDSEDLFERVRQLEIDIALAQQAHINWKSQCKRDLAIVAGVVGTGGGAVATALVKLIGG